ncbi:prophage protein [Secundilactobacillus pentosiphilus]|uniref:Prophage protein n=1 Tax=Secundilactobacillus pentosiphilus TaxID=1714682 RepID=A0A1Z5IUF9_9LACO|nr:prophage endopeptidase tail family protein [Secundilactobacillus pentosiphilus]GAX05367.1 prophage protein [Secundilactobacillus pentosiphilus]
MSDTQFKPFAISDVHNQYRANLKSVERSTVSVSWAKNETYELTFTADDDQSFAYSLLKANARVIALGQEWTITTAEPQTTDGSNQYQVTATNIGLECSDVHTSTKLVAGTYKPQDILAHYFDGNTLGYTYAVHGDFTAEKFSTLGSGSGKDGLSKITDTWKTAVIVPDGRQINVYSAEAWGNETGLTFRVGHDTSDLDLEIDPTGITNVVKVTGKTLYDKDYAKYKKSVNDQLDKDLKSTKKPYSDKLSDMDKDYRKARQKLKSKDDKDDLRKSYDAKTKPVKDEQTKKVTALRQTASNKIATELAKLQSDPNNFVGVTYRDEESIAAWGEHPGSDVSVKNETDTNKLMAAGKAKAHPDPTISISLSYRGKFDIHPGDIWSLDAKMISGIQTKVQVVELTTYPMDSSQPSAVTLNNTKTTITDIESSLIRDSGNALNKATIATDELDLAQILYNTDDTTGETSLGGISYIPGGGTGL